MISLLRYGFSKSTSKTLGDSAEDVNNNNYKTKTSTKVGKSVSSYNQRWLTARVCLVTIWPKSRFQEV
jgi:hypothetical protein